VQRWLIEVVTWTFDYAVCFVYSAGFNSDWSIRVFTSVEINVPGQLTDFAFVFIVWSLLVSLVPNSQFHPKIVVAALL
jgi:hypothetical protein